MKQTAVEWLLKELDKNGISLYTSDLIKQAKEMEKQQIEDAFNNGFSTTSWDKTKENKATEYYNKKFNK
jgi:hypothetical protein